MNGSAVSRTVARILALSAAALAPLAQTQAADLPVPCIAGSCGSNAGSWVGSGIAGGSITGNTFTINQQSANVTLNWQSFNIGADGKVEFKQPDASSVAVNRIFDNKASNILGALTANGRVYLLNQNGILFGAGSQVNVGGLVASTLNITPAALQNGIARAAVTGAPAFAPYTVDGEPAASGAITVEAGANITSANGQVFIFAPTVTNRGTISTPDGQTILAAGERVFLVASSDPNVRGLLVEVGNGGTVTNGEEANASRSAADLVGQITADRGNVTLAGLAVNQLGRVSATTSVRANGSIRLQARDTTVEALPAPNQLEAPRGGDLTLGKNSRTEVLLSGDTETTVDVNTQPKSIVSMSGKNISILSGANVRATSGTIDAVATENTATSAEDFVGTPDASRLFVDSNAVLDVSGASTTLSVERNSLRVELRGSQVQDSPLQRDGALRGKTVYVDIRQHGTRADGTTWQGTPIADLAGDVSAIQRDVRERNLTGGTINLKSQGAALISKGATLDVSGGKIDWQGGTVRTSKLLGTDGKLYDISAADRDRTYVSIVDGTTVRDQRWGIERSYGFVSTPQEAGYVEGKDAGSVTLFAPRSVLDGTINGNVTVGRYQRLPAAVSGAAGLNRPYDQIPLGAALHLGNSEGSGLTPDLVVGDVHIGDGLGLPGFGTGNGDAEEVGAVRVRTGLFGTNGVTRLEVSANGTISVDSDVTMPAGGEINLRAGRVKFDANVDVPAGTIVAQASRTVTFTGGLDEELRPRLEVASGVKLLARGQWVNENITLGDTSRMAPLRIDGGQITLRANEGDLILPSGSLIDVSAGARRLDNGAVQGGRGGSITLAATAVSPEQASKLDLGAELRAFALTNGGSLSLSAASVCISILDCDRKEDDVTQLTLAPEFFGRGGFSNISLAANFGGLTLEAGTVVTLRQQNLVLQDGTAGIASGADFATLVRQAELPAYQRNPLSLTLTARGTSGSDAYTDLLIGTGSAILAEPGARITLNSDSRVLIDGRIHAPSGTITAHLDAPSRLRNFAGDQGIWLGANAKLDASGSAVFTPDDRGYSIGNVFAGGTVSLDADRGYVVTHQSSVIDVSGTSVQMDVPVSDAAYQRRTVGSAGGSILFSAAEGMLLNGQMLAHGGGQDQAGGSLSVVLDPGAARLPTESFPLNDHSIRITAGAVPISMGLGAVVPDSYNGTALLSAPLVASGGFDSISLTARNLYERDPAGIENPKVTKFGRIDIEAGAVLASRASLTLEAPVLSVIGKGEGTFSSAYVSIGTADREQQDVVTPKAGDGRLTVKAGFLDFIGNVALDGLESARFDSSGDIRFRGVFSAVEKNYIGKLESSAPLTFRATQLYPSTLTQYTIHSGGADGSISVEQASGPRSDVLSAGGRLTLTANTIENAGTLRAPLGEVALQGESITVQKGGVISTSLEGLTVPFGTTQGGQSWAYLLEDGITRIYGTDGVPLPEQRVTLQGASVVLAEGSTIDVRGGGDLQAYEFLRGLGGSRDVLSVTERPGQYAIVPSLSLKYAPYDPVESRGTTLGVGQNVHLYAGSGLPEGDYVLLPARYALLPGAYLVTAASGYQDAIPGQSFARTDGSTVVAGYTSIAGTTLRDSRTSGFVVSPAAIALKQAQYTTTRASEFFVAQAAAAEKPTPRIPLDAGTASFLASEQLVLDGALRADVQSGHRGAIVELTSDRIRIADADSAPVDGFLSVSASQLSGLGAESLIIGGSRRTSTEGTHLDAGATAVVVGEGATLTAPEVVLVARDNVTVEQNARISAQGRAGSANADTSDVILLDDSSVLLRASAGNQLSVRRPGDSVGAGTLTLAAGSVVSATGSITVDVPSTAVTMGTFDIRGGSLALGSQRIGIGSAPADYAGLVFNPATVPAGLGELVLRGRESVDLFDTFNLSASRLVLDTPVLQAGLGSGQAHLSADEIHLGSSAPTNSGFTPVAGSSLLDLSARAIELTGGQLALSGFSGTSFTASESIKASGAGSLVQPGDLTLTSGVITADSGAKFSFVADGALSLRSTGAASIPTVTTLGGGLSFRADRIDNAGRIVIPAGRVEMISNTGNVVVDSGALIDVSGRTVAFDGVEVPASGGSISLTALAGNVDLRSDSLLDVKGAGALGAAGSVTLRAEKGSVLLSGNLSGASQVAGQGGSLTLAANNFSFDAAREQLTAGGFTNTWDLWLRGAGDFVVAKDSTIRANTVRLTADGGGITVNGSIDASGARAGSVLLASRDTITLNGKIDAHALQANVRGGRVELDSKSAIYLNKDSLIDVSGTALSDPAVVGGGSVLVRLPRSSILTVTDPAQADALAFQGGITGAREVLIEGVATYLDADGSIGFNDVLADVSNPWYAEAAQFASSSSAVLEGLGIDTDTDKRFAVRAGLEIQSTGDLSLDADWNLFNWRFDNQPGMLTLRAGGTLKFNASLSDGFSGVNVNNGDSSASVFKLSTTAPGESWSYRLVGGAQTGSANAMAVDSSLAFSDGSGNVEIAPGDASSTDYRMVRTGTGRIDLAAARDFVLGNDASMLYTAGAAGPGILITQSPGSGGLSSNPYPVNGGDIAIAAGRDIVGENSQQFVSDWLIRSGRGGTSVGQTRATAWTIFFDRFHQGLATLGGGGLSVSAGRDVLNLSASTPAIGRQIGGTSQPASIVQQAGGGDLTVTAGNDVVGSRFYVDRGHGLLSAGGSIRTADPSGDQLLSRALILGLGDSTFDVRAAGSIDIGGMINPTLLPPPTTAPGANQPLFGTYTADSGVSLVAAGGDVRMMSQLLPIENYPEGTVAPISLKIAPPSVRAAALSGSLLVEDSMTLWPAHRGNLELFAAQDVNLSTLVPSGQIELIMSDADVSVFLPTTSRVPGVGGLDQLFELMNSTFGFIPPAFHAANPVHGVVGSPDSKADDVPARIVANSGDVLMQSAGGGKGTVYIPKATRVVAGRDIVNLGLRTQHVSASDVSSMIAGRDVVYSTSRTDTGVVGINEQEINIAGPGFFEVLAGRDLDLRASSGITSEGNLRNPALPKQGASISVTAGLAGKEPAYEPFIAKYVDGVDTYGSALITFVRQVTGSDTDPSREAALTRFKTFSRALQRQFLQQILFAELRAGGRSAAAPGDTNGDFTRAFAALETYFPGSNPDVDKGETNAYGGDVKLYFSRIYTLSGGDINLLAPGGEVNVGLATPPDSFGIEKRPEQLGIVAQSTGSISSVSFDDFQVNESRSFAADGGDILVWATRGDIDAGRGAKTAISAPPPLITVDDQGRTNLVFPPALAGSGIQTLATSPGRKPGNVDLFAPRGVVNASDAGIVAGNLTIAATAVLGADNISVSGIAVGVPVDTGGLGASLAGVSAAASSASNAATDSVAPDTKRDSKAPLAGSALSWLEVFVEGFGDDVCKSNDAACLDRNRGQ